MIFWAGSSTENKNETLFFAIKLLIIIYHGITYRNNNTIK